jgi:hypothetical protein
MTKGREICNALKDIRQQIADKNEIEYATTECHFEGECQGTCPKCEAELQYIENEINRRKKFGKTASIAGISLGVAMTLSACAGGITHEDAIEGDMRPDSTYQAYLDSLRKRDSINCQYIVSQEDE